VGNLVDNVLKNNEAINFLVHYFLRGDNPVEQQPENINMLQYLATEGVLIQDQTQFKIISPLIRTMLLGAITAECPRKYPSTPLPIIQLGTQRQIDIIEMLELLLPFF